MQPVGDRARQARVVRSPLGQLGAVGRRDRGGRVVPAVRARVDADLEALTRVGRGGRVRQRRARVDVGAEPRAGPVGDRAARRAVGQVLVEPPGGAAVAVVVTGADHDRLQTAREVPEAWQRLLVAVHHLDQVGQQPLLLVGLRDGDLAQVDPVGRAAAEEHVVGADRVLAVALGAGPGRVALPCLDDGAGQVVGEGRHLPARAADGAQGDGREGGGRRGGGVDRGDRLRAGSRGERVPIGGTVVLDRVGDDAGPGGAAGVHLQVARQSVVPDAAVRPDQAGQGRSTASSRSGCRHRSPRCSDRRPAPPSPRRRPGRPRRRRPGWRATGCRRRWS